MATLTYVYSDSTAVLGPLASRAEPHGYDLCRPHAHSLSVPRGWEVIRLANGDPVPPTEDDLLALADAVREVGLSYDAPAPVEAPSSRRTSWSSGAAATSRSWRTPTPDALRIAGC